MSDPGPRPLYEEIATGQNNSGSSNRGQNVHVATAGPVVPAARLIPLDFNIYSASATSGDVYYMGPHQKDRQFALTIHPNSLAAAPKPSIILHDGLITRDPAIGTSRNAWVSGSDRRFDEFIVTVSPLGGSQPAEERLVTVDEGTYWRPVIRLRYSLLVAQAMAAAHGADDTPRQQFEWHQSSSREVQSLGGRDSGWRLVNLANVDETLAICVPNGHSLTKFLRFSFRGKGRTGSHFSPTWEVMAILTGLTTWERMKQLND
ncbi:unnamed protein product [Clonostachys rosea f. rosea IK726]|uniref:Uncharacterized protein n=1 Tax=Clonostachys rosea f. rosea IK726 TaxID=1349383 RepID=A0ACA9UHX0_BIOOC|nr:unnamed protein product [Clonostachys rosea f. rosea IK726]